MTIISLIVDVEIDLPPNEIPIYVAEHFEGKTLDLHCYVPTPEELEDRDAQDALQDHRINDD